MRTRHLGAAIAVAGIVVTIAVSAVLGILGTNALLTALLVGAGFSIAAAWHLVGHQRLLKYKTGVDTFLRHNWITAVIWTGCGLLCVYFGQVRKSPAEPFVQQIHSLVQALGLYIAVLIPPVYHVAAGLFSGLRMSTAAIISRTLLALANYSCALWLIGEVGDDLYLWTQKHSDEAKALAIATAIIYIIARVARPTPPGQTPVHSLPRLSAAGRQASIAPARRRSLRYTAVHEAGHALLYGALAPLPADLEVVINVIPDSNGVLGYVSPVSADRYLHEKSFAQWQMLTLLAGKAAEARALGETTLGSNRDCTNWMDLARRYLANQYQGIYFAEPENAFEQKLNEQKLAELLADQEKMLEDLFALNGELLQELAATLLTKMRLTVDDLAPLLRKVEYPAGFPSAVRWNDDVEDPASA